MDVSEDFAEYLSGQAFSAAAAFHEFLLLYEEDDGAVHGLFEGEDDPSYYLPEIRRRTKGRSVKSYICGGKWNVIEVRKDIRDKGYDIRKCLFFIDRDFDDYLERQPGSDQKTYVTDFYSIESHVADEGTARIVLTETVGMSELDPDFQDIIAAVGRAMVGYETLMRPLMAWCLATKGRSEKTNFNNAKLDRLFAVSSDGTVRLQPGAFRKFRKSVAAKGSSVSPEEMRAWRSVVRRDKSKLWLRGKYELWMFETILQQALLALIRRRREAGLRAPRMPSALRDRCVFDLVGGRLPLPQSLTEFLDRQLH